MNKTGPIIIIDDDTEDQEFIQYVFSESACKNQISYFSDPEEAYKFIIHSAIQPFLIISDIHMPKVNGFEFKRKIDNQADLKIKSVPFVFLTTGIDKNSLEEAYALSTHSLFKKPCTMQELVILIGKIVEYWQGCMDPQDADGMY